MGSSLRHTTSLFCLALPVAAALVLCFGWRHPVVRRSLRPTPLHSRIDVNTADADALCLLPGVGPGIARRIIAYRRRVGRFHRIADLERVKMIGPKTRARLGPWVVCAEVGRSSHRQIKSWMNR